MPKSRELFTYPEETQCYAPLLNRIFDNVTDVKCDEIFQEYKPSEAQWDGSILLKYIRNGLNTTSRKEFDQILRQCKPRGTSLSTLANMSQKGIANIENAKIAFFAKAKFLNKGGYKLFLADYVRFCDMPGHFIPTAFEDFEGEVSELRGYYPSEQNNDDLKPSQPKKPQHNEKASGITSKSSQKVSPLGHDHTRTKSIQNGLSFEVIVPSLTETLWDTLESIKPIRGGGRLVQPRVEIGESVSPEQALINFGVRFNFKGKVTPEIRTGTVVSVCKGTVTHVADSRFSKSLFAIRPIMPEYLTFQYLEIYEEYTQERYMKFIESRFVDPYQCIKYTCNLIHSVLSRRLTDPEVNKVINTELQTLKSKIRWLN